MPKALDPKEVFPFTLPEDEELEDGSPWKTVWHLQGLTLSDETSVANSLLGGRMGSQDLDVKSGDYQLAILRKGLVGWDNFNREDADGKPVPIPFAKNRSTNGYVKDDLLDFIDPRHRAQIVNAITARGKVTATEGNS